MAITWRIKISVLSQKRKNVSVILEQIDNIDLKNIKVLKTFRVLDALIDTPEQKQQIFTELKRQYRADKQKEIDDATIIGTLGEDIVNAAKIWEIK
jgi:hypothetical protein